MLDCAALQRVSVRAVVVVLVLLFELSGSASYSTDVAACEAVERDPACESCDYEPTLEPGRRAATTPERSTSKTMFATMLEPAAGPWGPDVFHPPRRS